VHELGQSADVSLVGFDRPAHLLEAFGLHGKTDTPKHKPRGFLGDTQSPRQFVGADAVLGIGEKPDRGKPLVQTERGVFEDCPQLNRELLAADAALPDAPGFEEHRIGRFTMGAHSASGPAKELKKLKRGVLVGEVGNRFAQGLRGFDLGHTESYNGGLGVSSILLPNVGIG
jgi:hypothetical protein